MDNNFEKIIDILIAIIIFFVFPLMYFSQRQETIIQQVISDTTNKFVDNVNSHGVLTKDMYDDYLTRLDDTNVVCNIKLEHSKLALEPEYRLRTAAEIINEQNNAYTGTNTYHYYPVSTSLPVVIDPIDNSGLVMNTETNESILAKAVRTSANPSHVHTEDCYENGNKYIFTNDCGGTIEWAGGRGYNATTDLSNMEYILYDLYHCTKDNTYFYHVYFTAYPTSSTGYLNIPLSYQWYIPVPATDNGQIANAIDNGAIKTKGSGIIQTPSGGYGGYPIINPTEVMNYFTNYLVSQGITVIPFGNTPYASYLHWVHGIRFWTESSLNLTYDYNGTDANGGGAYETFTVPHYTMNAATTICDQVITAITPTNPIQTVYVGEPLITTAYATYMDGSKGVVLCTADLDTSSPVKDKIVTLSYVNLKNQTLTCTMQVTVIPKTKICINGHIYNLNNDGSDPGCPYCRAWLKNLVVFNPAGGTLTIYRGTTLKENSVILFATYFDGHTEYVETGYSDNLDKYYIGTQDVTISYKGKNVNLMVITKRNIMQCPVCNHWYELYPDGTDPGCPYCKARTPIFTGNLLKYYANIYSDEILKEIYEGSGSYSFKAGDYFSVNVSNRNETLGTKILGLILRDVPKTSIHVEYGGIVREDANGY